MRHLAPSVVVGLAICCSSTAWAADHLMRVGEVLVSANNDTSIQYVELEDPVMEPFPSNPYALEIYDANGTRLGNPVQLTIAPDTQRILVGTANADTAFGTTRFATLPATLPANGQACFVRPTTNTKIMCLAWGCIQVQIVAPVMLRAPSPPTDQSVQVQGDGTYQLATPTPAADNGSGTTAPSCPTDPDGPPLDGPITPDAGVTPDAVDVVDSGAGADSGGGGNNNNGDDDDGGGCCQVDGSRGAIGACLLALGVVLALRSRRTRERKPQ